MLDLKIGSKLMSCKFAVVEDIYPVVIVGLKAMKNNLISVMAAWDCLTIEGKESIPFIGKTESVCENLNEKALIRRVGG